MSTQQKSLLTALPIEEREAFADIATHAGFRGLLKLVEQLVVDQENAVIRLTVSDGIDRLVHAKLRAEGARKLANDIAKLKQLVKERE